MTATIVAPDVAGISQQFSHMYRARVTVVGTEERAVPARSAVFVFHDGSPAFLCHGDLGVMACLSAPLMTEPTTNGMRPPEGIITSHMVGAFSHVLSISAAEFRLAGSIGVRLLSLYAPDRLPDPALALLDAPAWSVEVTVPGSGSGRLTFQHH